MNTASFVSKQLDELKASGTPLASVAWQVARLCVGWAYVFGARGQLCTPAARRARYSDDHPTIKTKCKNFDGEGACTGCQWYPGGERTRFFDCRGFTFWILYTVFGWTLEGTGATSQWNNAANWKARDTIDTMPKDTLCCLFVQKGQKMEHTGFGFNDETVECSNGVQYFPTRNKKWTHWAVPACIDGEVIPSPGGDRPTLRRGSKGVFVQMAQTALIEKGYSCGKTGADGDFGAATEKAVKAFQADHTDADGKPLTPDGVIGKKTWYALESADPVWYSVVIPHLTKTQADALVTQYPGSTTTEERG